MKNLEKYGVQEMDAKEIKVIEGGHDDFWDDWDPSQEAVVVTGCSYPNRGMTGTASALAFYWHAYNCSTSSHGF